MTRNPEKQNAEAIIPVATPCAADALLVLAMMALNNIWLAYVRVCLYIYIYIYIYIYMRQKSDVHASRFMYIFTYVYIHVCIHIHRNHG